MADHYQLADDDRFVLTLAAWFHDTGYTSGDAKGHENVSIEIASEFMKAKQLDDVTVQKVTGCIGATRRPQSPSNTIEKII